MLPRRLAANVGYPIGFPRFIYWNSPTARDDNFHIALIDHRLSGSLLLSSSRTLLLKWDVNYFQLTTNCWQKGLFLAARDLTHTHTPRRSCLRLAPYFILCYQYIYLGESLF